MDLKQPWGGGPGGRWLMRSSTQPSSVWLQPRKPTVSWAASKERWPVGCRSSDFLKYLIFKIQIVISFPVIASKSFPEDTAFSSHSDEQVRIATVVLLLLLFCCFTLQFVEEVNWAKVWNYIFFTLCMSLHHFPYSGAISQYHLTHIKMLPISKVIQAK